jgi:uncharacterized protein
MENSPLEFPSDHDIKVMGRNSPAFRPRVAEVLLEELGAGAADRIQERASREGTFLSLTCTVHVASRDDLERTYRALHKTGLVLYAL